MQGKFRLGLLIVGIAVAVGITATSMVAQASPPSADPTPTPGATTQSTKGWLGIGVAALDDKIAQRLGITQTTGLVVVNVMPQSPAATAGIQVKDILQSINGASMHAVDDLTKASAAIKPNDSVQVVVQRSGQNQTFTVTAASAPERRGGAPKLPRTPGGFGLEIPGIPGLPGLDALNGVAPGERLDHMLGGQFSYKDKDGNTVTVNVTFGKVVSASDASLVITPNGKSTQSTYSISANTKSRTKVSGLKAGDNVVVVSKEGSSEAISVMGFNFRPETRQKPATGGSSSGGTAQGFRGFDSVPWPAQFGTTPFGKTT